MSRVKRFLRFTAGMILMLGSILALASPDWFPASGFEVFSRNQDQGRDAGALFYTDLEDYWRLQEEVERAREESSTGTATELHKIHP
jgi:hypothetical protein